MGFYTTMFHVKQQDRLTHMFRGGWAPRSQAQPIRVCDIIVLYIMGYYVITSLIKERINMSKDKTKELIDSITTKDSLTAVKIAMELNSVQDKTTEHLIKLVASMDQNMKLLATKVLELEKRYERSQN